MNMKVLNEGEISDNLQSSKVLNLSMHSRVFRGLSGLESLRNEWETLHNFCDLWARFEWYFAYLKNLAVDSDNVFLIQIVAGEETVAIIPAEISKQRILPFGNLKVLCLAHHSHLILTDFPLSSRVNLNEVSKLMLESFRRLPVHWDVIRWPRIMHSSNALRIAHTLNSYSLYIKQAEHCNFLKTSDSFEKLSKSFTKKMRSNLRRLRKRLNEVDNSSIKISCSDQDSSESYQELLRLEGSGWKGGSGTNTAINTNNNTKAFYATLLKQKKIDFIPEIYLLMVDSKAIAGEFNVTTQCCMYSLKVGYDQNFSKYSPGNLLMEDILKLNCSSDAINQYCFVSGSPAHNGWQPIKEETFDVVYFRSPVFGRLFGFYLFIRKSAKSIILWAKSKASRIKCTD
jgi:CelD/BcsL family acetyltransferase involved in cellulose biosynthesis